MTSDNEPKGGIKETLVTIFFVATIAATAVLIALSDIDVSHLYY